MSELSAAIKNYGAANLASMLRSNPDFAVLNLIWGTPEELVQAFERMNWVTTAQVLEWVRRVNAAIGDTKTFVNLANPQLSIDLLSMPVVGIEIIHKAIVEQASTRADFVVNQADTRYRLPSKAQLELMGATCPIKRRAWVAETNDCDDFVNAFRGWLVFQGLGGIAHGFCGTTAYDAAGNINGGHAVVLVMDDTRKLWFLEPQNGKLYEVTYPYLGTNFFSKSVKIALANF